MSQQINLLLPELRPKRDWLAFPIITVAACAAILLVAGLAAWGRFQVQSLSQVQAQAEGELRTLQQQVQALGQAVAGRQPNPALQAEIEQVNEAVRQREEALRVAESGKSSVGKGHAGLMRGFARQLVDGVWLTGFSAVGSDVEIRGRLADPALLPQYIKRLNGDAAFQGRRFLALDMQDGAAIAQPAGASAVGVPRYTEFALRGIAGSAGGGKP